MCHLTKNSQKSLHHGKVLFCHRIIIRKEGFCKLGINSEISHPGLMLLCAYPNNASWTPSDLISCYNLLERYILMLFTSSVKQFLFTDFGKGESVEFSVLWHPAAELVSLELRAELCQLPTSPLTQWVLPVLLTLHTWAHPLPFCAFTSSPCQIHHCLLGRFAVSCFAF